jgi:hypothetical protein
MATIPWREQVFTTEAMPKYGHIVENILRDKENGWKMDYYRDTSTGYDMHVGRAQGEAQNHKSQIKKYEGQLNKITQTLEASKTAVPGVKKLSAKAAAALEEEYIEIYKMKCEQMICLDAAEKNRRGFEWQQFLQRKRLTLLQALRNDFVLKGDADYVRRGVTWIEEYIRKLRESSEA